MNETDRSETSPAGGPPLDCGVRPLVERLRERVLHKHGGIGDAWKHHWNLTEHDSELHSDAANNIERLRDMLSECRVALMWPGGPAQTFLDRLDAAIEGHNV